MGSPDIEHLHVKKNHINMKNLARQWTTKYNINFTFSHLRLTLRLTTLNWLLTLHLCDHLG